MVSSLNLIGLQRLWKNLPEALQVEIHSTRLHQLFLEHIPVLDQMHLGRDNLSLLTRVIRCRSGPLQDGCLLRDSGLYKLFLQSMNIKLWFFGESEEQLADMAGQAMPLLEGVTDVEIRTRILNVVADISEGKRDQVVRFAIPLMAGITPEMRLPTLSEISHILVCTPEGSREQMMHLITLLKQGVLHDNDRLRLLDEIRFSILYLNTAREIDQMLTLAIRVVEGIDAEVGLSIFRLIKGIPTLYRDQVVTWAIPFMAGITDSYTCQEILRQIVCSLDSISESGGEQMMRLITLLMQDVSDVTDRLQLLERIPDILKYRAADEREQLVELAILCMMQNVTCPEANLAILDHFMATPEPEQRQLITLTMRLVGVSVEHAERIDFSCILTAISRVKRIQVVRLAVLFMQGAADSKTKLEILSNLVVLPIDDRKQVVTLATWFVEVSAESTDFLRILMDIPEVKREKVVRLTMLLMQGAADPKAKLEILKSVWALLAECPLEGGEQDVVLLLFHMPNIWALSAQLRGKLCGLSQILIQDGYLPDQIRQIIYCIIYRKMSEGRMELPSPEMFVTWQHVLRTTTHRDWAHALAKYVMHGGKGWMWHLEAEPLIQTAAYISTLTKNPNDALSPYALYARLRAAAPLTRIPQYRMVGSQRVRLNSNELQTKANRCVLARDLSSDNPTQMLAALQEHAMGQDQDLLIEELKGLGLTLGDVKGVADPYVQSLMLSYSSPEQVVPADAVAWRCILRYVASLDEGAGASNRLSQRAVEFIRVVFAVHTCAVGGQEGITCYYNEEVDPQYKHSVVAKAEERHVANAQNCLWEVYKTELNRVLASHSPLMRQLTATADEDDIEQLEHQTLYVKNVVGTFLGLCNSVRFDLYPRLISPALLATPPEKILKIIYRHLPPAWFVLVVQTSINSLLSKEKISFSGLGDLVGYASEYWTWDEDDTPQSLTEAGACALLINEGYFQRLDSLI